MRRAIVWTAVAIVATVAVVVYYRYDPSTTSVFPRCLFFATTGYQCPGCGSQRAIHALLHGEVLDALRYNALLVLSLPLVAVLLVAQWLRALKPGFYRALNATWVAVAYLVVTLVWTIARNVL